MSPGTQGDTKSSTKQLLPVSQYLLPSWISTQSPQVEDPASPSGMASSLLGQRAPEPTQVPHVIGEP